MGLLCSHFPVENVPLKDAIESRAQSRCGPDSCHRRTAPEGTGEEPVQTDASLCPQRSPPPPPPLHRSPSGRSHPDPHTCKCQLVQSVHAYMQAGKNMMYTRSEQTQRCARGWIRTPDHPAVQRHVCLLFLDFFIVLLILVFININISIFVVSLLFFLFNPFSTCMFV